MAKALKKKANRTKSEETKSEENKYNRILKALQEAGMSQYRLHKDSGVSAALINAYCANSRQPSIETLFKLAKAMKVSPCKLLNAQ